MNTLAGRIKTSGEAARARSSAAKFAANHITIPTHSTRLCWLLTHGWVFKGLLSQSGLSVAAALAAVR